MLAFCDEAFVGEELGELDLARGDPVEVALRDHAHGGTDFFTRMREVSQHGAYAVHVGAEAMRGLPREWCRAYSLPTATSMSTAWYAVEIASSICREWCSRLQFVLNIRRAQGSVMTFNYSESDLHVCVRDPIWVALRTELPFGSRERERILVVDALIPKNH